MAINANHTASVDSVKVGRQREPEAAKVCCVIPAYKCRKTVCDVVAAALEYAHDVVVVDDACPEGSGSSVLEAFPGSKRVHVITLPSNGGVGAAVKTGIAKALDLTADIVVKIDGDGQMDPSYVPSMVEILLGDPSICLVKGNRFTDERLLRQMPALRLLGNSALSLLLRFASGYWDMLDPTNGFLAFNVHALDAIGWKKLSNRYFFESSVLCASGLRREKIAELEMPAIYASESSSLSLPRSAIEFSAKLLLKLCHRVLLQYFVFDTNIASLYMIVGAILCLAGMTFGAFEWDQALITGTARTPGTVMLAVLPLLMGFQLLLNALLYDVQLSTKIFRQPVAWQLRRRKRYIKP